MTHPSHFRDCPLTDNHFLYAAITITDPGDKDAYAACFRIHPGIPHFNKFSRALIMRNHAIVAKADTLFALPDSRVWESQTTCLCAWRAVPVGAWISGKVWENPTTYTTYAPTGGSVIIQPPTSTHLA